MNKLFRLFIYYFLVLCGFIISIFLFWRYFRPRLIQEVPYNLLTEYRFWILFYICCVYLFAIKTYIFPKNTHEIILYFSEKLSKIYLVPLALFDKKIKYNKYCKDKYYKFTTWALPYLFKPDIPKIIVIFHIFPRVILVSLLVLDIFWFNKLEIFFKFIFLGLFPLLFKYYKYCFYELKEHYLSELEKQYKSVIIFEKGYEFDHRSKFRDYAQFHDKSVSVREYFHIKYENYILWLYDDTEEQFEYFGFAFCREDVYTNYRMEKYNSTDIELTTKDYNLLQEQFEKTIPILIDIEYYIDYIAITEEENYIKFSKAIIVSIYFICWSYFLIVSTIATEGLIITYLEVLKKHCYEMMEIFGGKY